MNKNYKKIKSDVVAFCSSHNSLFLEENTLLLSCVLKKYYFANDFKLRNELVQMISMIRRSSGVDSEQFACILHSIAMNEFESGNLEYSEFLFRYICEQVDNISYDNNLAYILRRKRDNSTLNRCEIISLLLNGVRERMPFSLINMALLFSSNLSTDQDWITADTLFALLPDSIENADSWWETLGKNNDIEGYLVHFFLLRHKKIEQSSLGTIKSIAVRLKKNVDGFPDWLAKDYTIETINDIIECIDDSDFDTILEEFLEKMTCSRENVNKMLEVISSWDIWLIYNKLLTEFASLLTVDEIEKIKSDYTEKFSIPLPNEND